MKSLRFVLLASLLPAALVSGACAPAGGAAGAAPVISCGPDADGGGTSASAGGGATTTATQDGAAPTASGDGGGATPITSDASAPPATGGTTASYEAEDAFNAGTATFASSIAGFSGTGYVTAFGAAGAKVVFAVNAASDGTTSVTLRYANANGGAPKTVSAYVNGVKAADVALAPTSGTGFTASAAPLPLRTGLNTIAYVDEDGSTGAVSLDRLDLADGAPRPTRGAIVPFAEYEAEAGKTNGAAVGPGRDYGTVAAEASGRRAVTLGATGQYVEWTTTAPANALVVRYSMPDAPTGGGTSGTLGLYVNGTKQQALALSSKYAWVYGAYPYTNDPSQGSPHHYFDETPFLVGDIPAGATVRLQSDAGDAVVTVDLIDLELAPAPYAQPSGSLSITDYGATSGDGTDDEPAMVTAIAAAKAQNKVLWVPPGSFDLKSRVDVDHVTIRGAGPWSSVFHGASGKGGFNGTGDDVQLLDFAMFGDVSYRDDANFDSGVDGQIGAGSLVQNIWFEHTKVGVWLSGPTKGAYVVGCRIHDTFADGINLNGAASLSAAEHVHVRNTGDDAFAIWGSALGTDGNRFKYDTARLPTLANGMAIYGGLNNSVEDGDVSDTITASAGVAISTRFAQTPFGGTTSVLRTTVTRGGGHEPNWNTNFGGLWIYADTQSLSTPIVIQDVSLEDSTYQGILVSFNQSITNVLFDGVTIDGAGSYGIEVDATGGATFDGVIVSGAATASAMIGAGFTVTKGAGDTGW
jgi:hypothetical protein